MKILVTGGAGFIGSNFIHYWVKTHPQDQILNLDKLCYAGNLKNLSDLAKSKNYRFFKGDICNGKLVDQLMRGVDSVVHFAAESHVDRSILGSRVFIKTNVLGTYTLLEASVRNQVKHFHHVSTDEVFGSLPLNSNESFCEVTQYNPHSPYSASKAASDHLVRAYYHTYRLPVTITNCSNNFGPYQFPEKLIPLAITNLIEGKKVPIYGDGLNVRDWLYVEDHCRAIDLVLRKGVVGETYCVGGQSELDNLTLIKMMLKLMKKGEEWIEFVKDRPGHDRRYAINCRRIMSELGWRPKFDFEKSLKKTIDWYIENEAWWRPLKERQRKYFAKQYRR